jgi:putative flippase GtrA
MALSCLKYSSVRFGCEFTPGRGIWTLGFVSITLPAMRKHIHSIRDLVLPLIDFFYPPFRQLMSIQTFRYAASGATNTFLGLTVYYLVFKFILKEQNLDLGFYVFKSHVAALFIAFCFSFPFGFFLLKYVVFSDSKTKGRIQLVRYFMVYLFNLVLNYLLLKVLVENFRLYAPIAQIITTLIIIVFSYLAQRHYTFRIKDAEKDIIE